MSRAIHHGWWSWARGLRILGQAAVLTAGGLVLNASAAVDAVIYGQDDRISIERASEFQQRLGTGVAALVNRKLLIQVPEMDYYYLAGVPLARQGYDPRMRFVQEVSVASCTGFLIADDVLVTAQHCLPAEECSDDHVWVFNFQRAAAEHHFVRQEDIFTCAKVLKQEKNQRQGTDWAVVALDRPTVEHQPFLYRQSGKAEDGLEVITFGYPSGLPLKVAWHGQIKNNSGKGYFTASIDAFSGNSGSPVVDPATGMVEGLLVRGGIDYVKDESTGLRVPLQVGERYLMGEEVVRITEIPLEKLLKKYAREKN